MKKNIIIFILLVFTISCNKKNSIPKKNNITKELALNENDSISGIYKTKSDSITDCKIILKIYNSSGKYYYQLETTERNVKGKIHFESEGKYNQYLILEGIKWDEYAGNINEKMDSEEWNGDENIEDNPIEISASIDKDTLIIQNSGNSMNYFTIFAECGTKYIQLIKQ